jgi:hypothetical protein
MGLEQYMRRVLEVRSALGQALCPSLLAPSSLPLPILVGSSAAVV